MQFLFPGVLYGLFAISIPIIIHLFNFRKYKTVYFSNTQYLKSIKQNTKSRNRLKHLLILLARILTIIFLVLAFAKPFIPSAEINTAVSDQVVGIYIDNSFSMEAESKFGRTIEVAKKRAIEISKSFDASTEFMFITNDRKAIHNHLINSEQLIEFAEETATSPIFSKISDIVNHFNSNIEIHKNSNIPKKLFVLSDFQKNAADFNQIKPDSLLSLVFLPLSSQKVNNLYIDSCWFETPYRKFENEENLSIRIVNNSSEIYNDIPISFYINDSVRALSSISLEPNSSKVEQINFKNTSKGIMNCRVEIQDYPIIHDNTYYFSYTISKQINLLSINQSKRNKNLNVLFGLDNYFNFKEVNYNSIDYSKLENYDVVILNEIDEFSNVLINQSLLYVKNGGRLVIIPSTNISFDSYNLFYSAYNNNLVTAKDTTSIEMDKINFLSDIYLQSFENVNDEHILPAVKPYYKNQNYSVNKSISLIDSKNNYSLLNYTKYMGGDIFTFYFPLSTNNESFNIHPVFIPTFYNISLNSQNTKPLSYNIGTSKIIETSLDIENYDNVMTLMNTNSNYEFIPRIEQKSKFRIYLENQLIESGNYLLKLQDNIVDAFAFNYSKMESKLDFYDKAEIQNEIELNNLNNSLILQNDNTSFEYGLTKINQGTQLWYYLVLLALLFVLLEIALIKFLP